MDSRRIQTIYMLRDHEYDLPLLQSTDFRAALLHCDVPIVRTTATVDMSFGTLTTLLYNEKNMPDVVKKEYPLQIYLWQDKDRDPAGIPVYGGSGGRIYRFSRHRPLHSPGRAHDHGHRYLSSAGLPVKPGLRSLVGSPHGMGSHRQRQPVAGQADQPLCGFRRRGRTGPFFQDRFIKRQIAWCYSLSRGLRGQESLAGVEKYVSRSEMHTLKPFSNSPMALLEQHGADLQKGLRNGFINPYQQVEIDRTLSKLSDSMGKCERIKNTIFPATYSLYIHFSLLFFFLLLPFALIDIFGLMTIR